MSETIQHATMKIAIPFKERLIFSKDPRYQKQRDFSILALVKIVIPVIVLNKNNKGWLDDFKKKFCICF